MLDWMKKLFNKEEEKTVMNKEVPAQIESQPKIPRVNHYTEAREAQMASRNAGKCRFPLIPDNGFDEEDVRELPNFEEQPIQRGAYEEQPTQRGIKVERSRRPYVETEAPTYEEPELQYEPEPEPVVKKAFVPSQESNRRPFRPTEMISPIYGYNRPSVETKVVQEEEKVREDLEISVEGKAVVDAWLEKKGYTLSDFSGVLQGSSSVKNGVNERSNKVEEKSVVDTWLEKNGYEVERQAPSLEESLSDDLLHKTVGQHVEKEATIVQALKQEQDVVALSSTEDNEETLQEESIDSKVEHVYSILTEENECNTEIEETVAEVAANQVEEETLEDVVIVKADEKLEETITIEIPDAFEEEAKEAEEVVELEETEEAIEEVAELEEAEEATEEVVELEEAEEAAEEVVELEKSEEATEEVVELEKPEEAAEEVVELEKSEEATEEVAELEEAEEATEEVVELEEAEEAAEEVVELEKSEEATEEVVELEETKEATEEVAELEEAKEATEEVMELEKSEEVTEEVVELEETKEATEEVMELEKSEEVTEEVVELEETKEATEEVVELEETKEAAEEVMELEKSEEVTEEVVELEETKEATEEVMELEKSEEVTEEVVELEETKEATEEVVELEKPEEAAEEVAELEEAEEAAEEVAELEEAKEATEEVVELEKPEEATEEVAELEGTKEEEPISQETVIEETMNTDLVENTPVAEQPVISQQETITFKEESEVFVPVSETDEQTKKDVQNFANVLIEEAEEKKQVAEEQPALQIEELKREKKRHVPFNVVMLKQDRKKLMERHAARTNVMQSTVSERVEEKPVQQVVVEPQAEEKPMQQMVVDPQVEEKPVQQVVVNPQVEESPVQQVVVEAQVEEKPMQQVVVEAQVEEKPMQQVVVAGQVQESISSTEVQEKAYVVNQKENDMRNVLQAPPKYELPPLTLLSIPQQAALDNTEWLEEQEELLNTTFNNFHVGAHVINVSQGPAVTRFEVQPDPGVKVNKITNLSDDIKLSLAAKDIRIEAPIPGKSAIGIEVPNKESKPVFLREILRSPVFTKSESPLTVALGLDISGDPIVTDIRKMPHGLIAGATGSGKSVCINAILTSILYKAKPHEVKLILIDPKMVELAPYNSVPHLVAPVITDVKAATAALKWAVEEMERRYELFAHAGARDLTRYNTIVSGREIPGETLPYIVIVIDELADLMMVAPGDVEEAICRIAQKARACGIHLLVATQRPSVDVITGLIKSNIPTRIAFTVSSQVDSRTIIDIGGAEKLLGRGDMLFLGNGTSKPVRVQGVYVSDDEIERTVDHVKKQMKPNYLFKQEDLLAKSEQSESEDELFFDACQFVVEQGGASTSSVQRKFRIGYNRAARLIEEMESQGIISEGRGTKPRDVLISEDEFAAMQETNV
ncbi:DNA translocase FtsK [Bacillus sp. TH44]|uniref:DNA translocase FtsK n=1 Tax=unclassified Bacillus (in: firmicutes) TaxID=185979 RepID=UPI001911A49F|nr:MULTISPECIES: DNA translocase FtsK [unclassified Bacillus (in: firmicutes)]MBK5348940.1 DNA translocase FtsK [Bacillus sp. TH45]MBK5358019.1 DNA translocase FtsK [Bacillus sp. TH44]MBK5364159.1 DNA translocase FtsK [Bacillus sp. TH50]